MKKLAISAAVVAALLSTTAMAEVSISGTSEFYYKNDDSQITANNGDSMGNTDNEIIFKFGTKTDTGLGYGIVVELATDADSNAVVDESSMYIEGSMGKVVLGGNDAVTDNFGIGEQDIMDEEVTGTYTSATIQSNAGENSYGADLTKASYFTPTFGGFQAGVSFYDSGAAGTTDSTSYGASYTIDNLKIGYTNGSQEVAAGTVDNESQSLGAKLALGNATLIAAVSKVEGDDEDIDSIGFGASYKVNTDITVAASTMNSEDSLDLSGTEKEELTQHMLEIKYQIAPGLAGYVNYTDYDYNNGGEASTDDDGAVTQFKIAASF
jgi:outer membrane protein OmpU